MKRIHRVIRLIGGFMKRTANNAKNVVLSRQFGAFVVALIFVLGFGWLTNLNLMKIAHAIQTEGFGMGVASATGTTVMATALELPTFLRKAGLLIGTTALLAWKFHRLLLKIAHKIHDWLDRN